MLRRGRLLFLVGLLILPTRPSLAARIEILGTPGAQGTPAVDGGPFPANGGNGGPGGDITQSLVRSDDTFVVIGGSGGAGGSSLPYIVGGAPLSGGDGGAGGDSTVTVATGASVSSPALAESHGGDGGIGGAPSIAQGSLPAGTPGDGGNAGDASLDAVLPQSQAYLRSTLRAFGGSGGSGAVAGFGSVGRGGDGGNAHISVQSPDAIANFQVVNATVAGGDGGNGSIGGLGGSVDVGPISAGTSASSPNYVEVTLDARPGDGGSSVIVGGQNAPGGNLSLHNAVAGIATDYVRLSQVVHGGNAGGDPLGPSAAAADGGDASSTLALVPVTSALDASVEAAGGAGSQGSAGTGNGGTAHAGADVTSSSGLVILNGDAVGGAGGGTGAGGDASFEQRAVTTGDEHRVEIGLTTHGAIGGSADSHASALASGPGGRGGNATSSSYAETSGFLGYASAIDSATGGNGGGIAGPTPVQHDGGAGGDASSSATAISLQQSSGAYATAIGGRGGDGARNAAGGGTSRGGDGGTAQAQAFASGPQAGASVTQIGGAGGDGPGGAGRGADSFLDGAAQAESGFNFGVSETAVGGAGGVGPSSRGGDAGAAAAATRDDHFFVAITVAATGGAAYAGGVGGDARVSGSSTNSTQGVYVDASAIGGSAKYGVGTGGDAVLEHVEGRSLGGGSVEVNGRARGGDGSQGVSIDLDNAVIGDTTGDMRLTQEATGGSGVFDAGSARSRLTRTGSFTSITAIASATAGSVLPYPPPGAGPLPPLPPVPPDFGRETTAIAEVDIHNSTGAASADATAIGSNAGPIFDAHLGGLGSATAKAEGSGVGQRVHAGATSGGGAGHSGVNGTDGGSADALSVGIGHGDGPVDSVAVAYGGDGGSGSGGASGVGGGAHAEAHGVGAGTALVDAASYARAGSNGYLGRAPASAIASAEGLGAVRAAASASGNGLLSTSAHSSTIGVVTSVAIERDSYVPVGSAPLGATASTGIREEAGAFYSDSSVAEGLPSRQRSSLWLGSSPELHELTQERQVFAIGDVSGEYSSEQHSSDRISFELAPDALEFGQPLSLGFAEFSSSGLGVDVLHVALELNGASVFDTTFANFAAASAALTDSLVDISLDGVDLSQAIHLALLVDIGTGSDTGSVSSTFALIGPAPEPGVLALVALGFAMAFLRMRRLSP